jgi:hypothetical protein
MLFQTSYLPVILPFDAIYPKIAVASLNKMLVVTDFPWYF